VRNYVFVQMEESHILSTAGDALSLSLSLSQTETESRSVSPNLNISL
jgi:hypothetical protein